MAFSFTSHAVWTIISCVNSSYGVSRLYQILSKKRLFRNLICLQDNENITSDVYHGVWGAVQS